MRASIRLASAALLFTASLFPQGGGGVQFRDYHPPAPTAKPRAGCAGLVALTGYEFSVYSAALVPASETAPEHCRVDLLVSPTSTSKSTCRRSGMAGSICSGTAALP